MKKQMLYVTLPISAAIIAAGAWLANAGPLNPPPGPVASTGRFGPRVDVLTLPGSGTALHTINQPGSYYLSANLTGAAGMDGIEIDSNNVTLDLNGFSLIGGTGSGDGIDFLGFQENVVIQNGSVYDWDGAGIRASMESGRVERIVAASNGEWGIDNGDGFMSHIITCEAISNGLIAEGGGIRGGSPSHIADCVVSGNVGDGILGKFRSHISNCTSFGNTDDGIVGLHGSRVSGCVADSNGGDGIEVTANCYATGNQCDGNGATDGAGIHATTTHNRIEGNNVTGADRGIDVDAMGNIIVKNTARGNTTNYDISAGNKCGTIVDITAGGQPGISGNSAASTVASTDPWANFAY